MASLSLSSSKENLKKKFYELESRKDVADILEITEAQLNRNLFSHSQSKAYITFEIPKKSGNPRSISTPITSLKIIQRKLCQILTSVYKPKPSTHGFTENRSIITNASKHTKQRYVLNIDIENFFSEIHWRRVRGLLMARPYSCNEEIATILTKLVCYKGILPQGAPTSPIISNMICAKLDSQLQRLAQKYQCVYTRYADDITFSTSKPRFPPHIAWFSKEAEKLNLGDELQSVIKENGFKVNNAKTRLQYRSCQQEVTGITVNEKLNIKREYIRQVRAMLHAWEKYGLEHAESDFFEKYDKRIRVHQNQGSFQYIVRGKIDFIGAVRGREDEIYLKHLRWLKKLSPNLVSDTKILSVNNIEDLNTEEIRPKIEFWTEGKTDIKHLRSAVRYLSNHITNFNFDFRNCEGSPELLKLYNQAFKTKRTHLLICMFDRDEPAIIKQIHDDTRGFKVCGNGAYSFAIPIPKHRSNENGICIEHYYQDNELMREDSKGRRLFLSNEFNPISSRHLIDKRITAKENNKVKSSLLKIIDADVYNQDDINIAMTKDDFADYILNEKEGFDDFNFSAFQEIFDIISKIKDHYLESLKNDDQTM